jgi:hypothetical protein
MHLYVLLLSKSLLFCKLQELLLLLRIFIKYIKIKSNH